tara:strand:+ start:52 stop:585 length:534 start_codon:yes stop_codon:yes gene_type:complete
MAHNNASNYNAGKKQEKEADVYIRQYGLCRPSAQQRKIIKEALRLAEDIEINISGFDLIPSDMLPFCNNVGDLTECLLTKILPEGKYLPDLVLYEMKSAGSSRKSALGKNWKGFGFTYSENEDLNWQALGDDRYKFVFVDMQPEVPYHLILHRDDWYKEEFVRIYSTKSIFIKGLNL